MLTMSSDLSAQRQALTALAYTQAGYFSAAQARERGFSYQRQKHHVDAGNWLRVGRGLFRLADWPAHPDDSYALWAVWSGGRAVVSHESALVVHQLTDVNPSRLHLSVPVGFRARTSDVTLHKDDVPARDRQDRGAWSVTTVMRTLTDVAASSLSQEHVDNAVGEALDRDMVTRRQLIRRGENEPPATALRLERALARSESNP